MCLNTKKGAIISISKEITLLILFDYYSKANTLLYERSIMYLEHINIRVPSIQKTQEFLKAAFPDFRVRGTGFSNTYGYWSHFGNDDTYIALSQSQPLGEEKDQSVKSYLYDDNYRLMHSGLVIEDVDAIIYRLNNNGYTPVDLEDLNSHPYRKRVYYFDNNGVEWEFIQYISEKPSEKNDYTL